jgi:hypothetical protein
MQVPARPVPTSLQQVNTVPRFNGVPSALSGRHAGLGTSLFLNFVKTTLGAVTKAAHDVLMRRVLSWQRD